MYKRSREIMLKSFFMPSASCTNIPQNYNYFSVKKYQRLVAIIIRENA